MWPKQDGLAYTMKFLSRLFAWLLGALLVLGAAAVADAATPAVYTVSVVPQFAVVKVYQDWQPFLAALQKATGLRLRLVMYPTIPGFEAAYLRGAPDFAFMNPYDVLVAHRAQGYVPLVHDAKPLAGILVVRADSGISSLHALDGKTVAFPAPNAFGASLYMRALLAAQGVHIHPLYVGTHQNVYRAVARGDALAGGGVALTLRHEPQALRRLLRVIYTTPSTAPHALVANPRVPVAVARRVQQAVLAMARQPADATMLRRVQMPHPQAADYARDYAPLEKLGLQSYFVSPAQAGAR